MTVREHIGLQTDATEPFQMVGRSLAAAVPTNAMEIPYRPFPVEALPQPVRAIVSEASRAIGCDPAAVALPAISGLGVAIGNTRVLLAKNGWRVPPIIWSILAMPSGSQKSPALDITAAYFRKRQGNLQADYRQRLAAENAKKNPKDRVDVDPKVVWADDTTTEALAAAMETNPRGILLASDEIGNWFGGMGLYKNNGAIADVSRYCQWYGGRAAMILRKDKGRRTTFAKGVLGITGTMTLSTLQRLADPIVRDSGLLARMLPCCPPVSPRRWTDDTVAPETTRAFHDLLDQLFQLEAIPDGPREIRLGAEARRRWQAYFNNHNAEQEVMNSDHLRAAWSKLEELPCRLALILHECEGGGHEVSLDVMERAITMTEWFKHETRRVYAMLFGRTRAPAAESNGSKLLDWMEERGWVTEREITRLVTPFKGTGGADAARAVLRDLIANGQVESEEQPAGKVGGRPTLKYRLVEEPQSPVPAMADTAQNTATTATQPTAAVTQPRETRDKPGSVTVADVAEEKRWIKP